MTTTIHSRSMKEIKMRRIIIRIVALGLVLLAGSMPVVASGVPVPLCPPGVPCVR